MSGWRQFIDTAKPELEDNKKSLQDDSKKSLPKRKKTKQRVKRQKHNRKIAKQKLKDHVVSSQKGKNWDEKKRLLLTYLSDFKHNRSEWLFSKVMQVFLIKHLTCMDLLGPEHNRLIVKYIKSIKGAALLRIEEYINRILDSENPESKLTKDQIKRLKKIRKALDKIKSKEEASHKSYITMLPEDD